MHYFLLPYRLEIIVVHATVLTVELRQVNE